VANAFGISRHHLVKIVHDLGRHGYLATQRGIGGGFTLALPPEKIGVGDVVRLGEESELVIDCKDRRNRFCQIFPACRLKVVLDEAAAAFFAVLDSYTLEDLLGQRSALKDLLQIGDLTAD
jgi:Rrf2 family nitric oxide-sensitive transcriptional repressor